MVNTTDSKGRIVYFEPNELFGGDNQPVNQEDLTKYVNLSVRIPSRIYNPSNNKREYDTILRGHEYKEKKNGIEYTKLYLTDNYVNVSYTEFGKNGQISNGELFGVESINISFDVQLQPIVVINFVDIRGCGLMSTMEHNYSAGKINNMAAKSFFTSLFNFPYPIFTLEVKGYYGRNVSFDLSLKDFNTSFDSASGNFKTTVSFIGYLYGVYSDIPMSFIMASPYFDYKGLMDANGGDVWKSLGGYTIPTYCNLLGGLKDIISGDNIQGDSVDTIRIFQSLMKEKKELLNIKEIYEGIIEIGELKLKSLRFDDDRGYFIKSSDDGSSKMLYKYRCEDENLNKDITYFLDTNENKTEGGIMFPYKKFDENIDPRSVFELNGRFLYNEYENIKNEIDAKYKLKILFDIPCQVNIDDTMYSIMAFVDIYDKHFLLQKEIDIIDKTLREKEELITKSVNNIIANNLGFNPTIKNIYQILFKHINCFSKHFYNTINQIDSGRNKENLQIIGNYITDVVDYEKGTTIPPFPMFLQDQNNRREVIYPGNIVGFIEQPEVIMVEKIYESIKYFTNKVVETAEVIAISRIEEETGEKINLKIGNFFSDIDQNINIERKNYFKISKVDNNSEIVEKICQTFLQRLNAYVNTYTCNENVDTKIEEFIDNEVKLLNISNPHLTENILLLLENYTGEIYDKFTGSTDSKNLFLTYDRDETLKIDNSLRSTVRLLAAGTRDICETFLNGININGKYFFNEPNLRMYKYDKIELAPAFGFQSGRTNTIERYVEVGVLGYFNNYIHNKIAVLGTPESGSPVGCKPSRYDRWSYDFYYVYAGSTIFTENELELHKWSCSSYEIEKRYVEKCSNTDSEEFIYKSVYTTTKKQGCEGNKISIISLMHLLAIGEMFYEDYHIPISEISSGEQYSASILEGYEFEKIIKSTPFSNDFKDFFIDLYCFYKKENRNYKYNIEEILNKYNISLDNVDIKDTNNIWFVIGKERPISRKIISKNEVEKYWGEFIKKLYPIYNFKKDVVEAKKQHEEIQNEETYIKNNIYYTLKTLYDKWFCGLNSNFFDMYQMRYGLSEIEEDSEFNKIKYITTTFNDISDNLIVDIEAFTNQILSIKENPDNISVSVLSYMAKTAQDNQSTFLVLPTNIFDQNLKEAFGTYSFYNGTAKHDEHGATYVVMYNGDVSHILDNEDSEYSQDGYTIADYSNGTLEITEEAAQIMANKIESEHDYTVQAFGVTYGMQNQNIFRNISIDTQTPQVTDYSIANMLNIAEQGSGLANGGNLIMQSRSLYPIYANRSYNCIVEMMGCMNISPLMYFQLNNIPMFKGAYMITNVEHRITPNDFVTTFTGVRVSKYNIPISKKAFNINRIGSVEGVYIDKNEYKETFKKVEEKLNSTVTYLGMEFISADPEEKYWFPYSGFTSGRAVDGRTYNSYADDCMASVRKSIAMILTANFNDTNENPYEADPAFSGISGPYTSKESVVQLLYEKYDGSITGGTDYNLYYVDEYFSELFYDPYVYKYEECIDYMRNMIDNRRPICVGVTHSLKRPATKKNGKGVYNGNWLNEGVTDHWLCVYAYGNDYSDKNNPKVYFKFYESGSNRQEKCVSNQNILIFEFKNGKPMFYCRRDSKDYHVTQVRVNKKYIDASFTLTHVGPQRSIEEFVGDDVYLALDESYRYTPL